MRRYPSPDQPEPLPLSDEWLAQYRALNAQWILQSVGSESGTWTLADAVGPLLDEVDRLRKIVALYRQRDALSETLAVLDRRTHTHDGVQIDKAIHPMRPPDLNVDPA